MLSSCNRDERRVKSPLTLDSRAAKSIWPSMADKVDTYFTMRSIDGGRWPWQVGIVLLHYDFLPQIAPLLFQP